jgi:glycosyltransferase involved in cell wall biosynthesis
MKVLWIVNVTLPEVCEIKNITKNQFGGWLDLTSKSLSKISGINLTIAFPEEKIDALSFYKGKKINYISFPSIRNLLLTNNQIDKNIDRLIKLCNPDIIHIFGSEYSHTFEVTKICNKNNIKFVLSIQGLTSVIADHFLAGIPTNVQKRFTIKDFFRQENLIQQKRKFIIKGKNEVRAIKNSTHIIGRTEWDRTCINLINPNAKYHFCNENLRSIFYKNIWDSKKYEKYSIFVSQASYPIKGIHFMIKALSIIVKDIPEVKLYIAGNNIIKSDTIKDKLRQSSYSKYVRYLIKKNHLDRNIIFTGLLSEEYMCKQYLKANIFVSSSTIENSSNSLGEAMILGVPCISSYVGGIPSMITHNKEGFLYQADAPYMLASYCLKLFKDEKLAKQFSFMARKRALMTHNVSENNNKLISIYKSILNPI